MDTPVEASSSARPLISGMRAMFVVSCVTVSLAGFQLFVLSEYTDRFFAWTIDVPLTAAFLGASYWGSFALELVASQNDFGRVYAGMAGLAVLGALQLLALARYSAATVDWSSAGGWIYLLFVLSVLSAGLYGWLEARRRIGRLST